MKQPTLFTRVAGALALVVLLSVVVAGCSIIGGIFKAGAIVGILVVVVILAIVFWIAGKFRGK
jgi:hypothetical protein